MVPELFVEEVYLVVEHLHADQDGALLVRAPAEGLHLSSLGVLLKHVLVVVVQGGGLVADRVDLVEEEGQQHEVVVEILHQVVVRLLQQVKGSIACAVHREIWVLQAELADEVAAQVLNLHGVCAGEEVAARAMAATIGRLLHHLLLSLIIVHTEQNKVHLLQDLEVHIDYFLAVKCSLQECQQLSLLEKCLDVLEDLAKLERIPLCKVLWERKRIVWAACCEQLLILLEPVLHDQIVAAFNPHIQPLRAIGELDELLSEHLVKELLEGLVLLA